MSVSARFYVQKIEKHAGGSAIVTLGPAYRGEENKAWSSATPAGSISLTVSNPAAVEWFDDRIGAGDDLAITFEVLAKPTP